MATLELVFNSVGCTKKGKGEKDRKEDLYNLIHKNPSKINKIPLELTSEDSKVAGYNNQRAKASNILYTDNNLANKTQENDCIYSSAKKL